MKTLKVIGLLVLVFLAGLAGGVEGTRIVVRRMVASAVAHPELVRMSFERALDRRLHLDAQQREKVHDILKDSYEQRRIVREEFQPKFNAVTFEARTNISAVLTLEQEKRFEEFLEDYHQFLPVRELPPLPRKD